MQRGGRLIAAPTGEVPLRQLFLQHFTLPRRPHQARPQGEPASPEGSFCTVSDGNLFILTSFYPEGFRNGTQAVPYGFADWFILEPTYFKSGHVRRPKNCQLSIVNFSAAPTVTLVGGTVHPHGLYMQRCLVVLRAANQNLLIAGGNHTMNSPMNHRRYIAWYHSSAQVLFETWRAANSR